MLSKDDFLAQESQFLLFRSWHLWTDRRVGTCILGESEVVLSVFVEWLSMMMQSLLSKAVNH